MLRRTILCACTILALLCAGTLTAAAEVAGAARPGQIERQFQPEPEMRADRPAPIEVPEADQPIPANAEEIRFVLTALVIEGSTVYSDEELLEDTRAMVGREVSLADIYNVASVLTARYRNDGYILSQVVVPAQTVEDGRVRLAAIEGFLAAVTITGIEDDRRGIVRRYADRILASRPLNNRILERYLLLMNDLPGAFARAAIGPSEDVTGASEMTIEFIQRPLQGVLSVDNRGGESLGPWWISGDIMLNSLLGLQEKTTVRAVSSGDNKLIYGSLSHEHVVGSDGGSVSLTVSAVRAEPKEMFFIPLNLETSSQTATLMYRHPLIRSRAQNFSIRGGFTLHEGETRIFNVVDTRDRIRVLKIGGTYDRADAWHGINLLDIELSRGISGLGSSSKNDMLLSRPYGKVDFTKLSLYAARLQSLSPRVSLLAAVNAQYAFNDLLSSELFSLGGAQFGRGYDPSELVGDTGAALKLELRYSGFMPDTPVVAYTAYTFYDAGIVYYRSPGGTDKSDSAASAGVGLRVSLGKNASCYVEVAKPLTRDVSVKENRDPRVYGGVSVHF